MNGNTVSSMKLHFHFLWFYFWFCSSAHYNPQFNAWKTKTGWEVVRTQYWRGLCVGRGCWMNNNQALHPFSQQTSIKELQAEGSAARTSDQIRFRLGTWKQIHDLKSKRQFKISIQTHIHVLCSEMGSTSMHTFVFWKYVFGISMRILSILWIKLGFTLEIQTLDQNSGSRLWIKLCFTLGL